MTSNRKSYAFLAGAFIAALFLACEVPRNGDPTSREVLRIPDTRFMGILPLYVADEKGFFDRHGVNIEWVQVRDPGQAGRMFFAGQADFIMTTFANLVPAEAREPGTVRFLLPINEPSENPGSYILIGPDSDLEEVTQLRGRKLGTYSGPSQKAYALVVLRALGLSVPEDVELIQVASSAQVQGLFGGTYDALFTVETYGSTAIVNGAKVLAEGVRPRYIQDPFWLGAAAIPGTLAREKPELVEEVLAALAEAVEFIAKNEEEARRILARRTATEPSVAEVCALYTWVAHPTEEQLSEVQEHVEILEKEGLIDTTVNISRLFEGVRE